MDGLSTVKSPFQIFSTYVQVAAFAAWAFNQRSGFWAAEWILGLYALNFALYLWQQEQQRRLHAAAVVEATKAAPKSRARA